MLYSVWNQGTSAYDYYESGSPQATLNVEKPAHLGANGSPLGLTIDQAAWKLPAGARAVGSGVDAVGRIAVMPSASSGSSSALSDITDDIAAGGTIAQIVVYGGAALAIYALVKHITNKPGWKRAKSAVRSRGLGYGGAS